MKNFITCDIGKKTVIVFNPNNETHRVVSTDSFRDLEFPEIDDGMTIVIEDAHLRSQEDNSLAHTYKIDELQKLRSKADKRNIKILCFPQNVTPKARKLFTLSLGKTEVIDKTDKNDTEAIAFYLRGIDSEVLKSSGLVLRPVVLVPKSSSSSVYALFFNVLLA